MKNQSFLILVCIVFFASNIGFYGIAVGQEAPVPSFTTQPQLSSTTITLGGSFDITMAVYNGGGASDEGGIAVSFPSLTGASDGSSVVQLSSGGDSPGLLWRPAGTSIYNSSCVSMTAQYLLTEYVDNSWTSGETNTLTLRVTPKAAGTFYVYVRTAMHHTGSTACDYVPAVPTTGTSATDQQGWSVKRYAVTVLYSGTLQGIVFRDADQDGIYTNGVDPVIPGASVCTQYGDKTLSSDYGAYLLMNLRPAWGYSVTASARDYIPKTLESIEIFSAQITSVNIAMDPLSMGASGIRSLIPDPNPQISEVEKGGSAHRYYLVSDSLQTAPLAYADVEVFRNGAAYKVFSADESGLLNLTIPSSDVGNGEPDQMANFRIVSINGSAIPSIDQIAFECKVIARQSFKVWENSTYGRFGLSYFVLEGGTGARTSLISNPNDTNIPEKLRIERQGRAGAGFAYNVQSPFQVSVNDIGIRAEAGAEGLFSIITDDAYEFPHPISSDAAAEAAYILLASSKTSILDNALLRLLTFLEDDLDISLDQAYLSDTKGVDFRGSVSGGFTIGVQEGRHVTIGAKLEGGLETHTTISSQWLAQENAERLSLGCTVMPSVQGSFGLIYNKPKSLESELFLEKLGLSNYWSGTWGGELASRFDGISRTKSAIEIASTKREEMGTNAREDNTKITITGDEAMAAFSDLEYAAVSSFLSPWGVPIVMAAGPGVFSYVLIDGMSKVADLQNLQKYPIDVANRTRVEYEKERVDVCNIDGFDLSVDLSATGEQTISGHLGLGTEFRQGNGAAMERGQMIRGIPYALESYDDIPQEIPISYSELWKSIEENIPFYIKALAFLTNILPFGTLAQQAATAEGDTFVVGGCGARIIFPVGSVPDSISSVSSNSWGWWGGSPCASPSMLSKSALVRHKSIRAEAQESFGLSYGIGGFYQFEPYDLGLNAPATFIMTYQDADVVGVNESDLAMFREIKETHEFEFLGGIVDTLNNTVTAVIDTLGLFTLAPRLPAGAFILHSDPPAIPADGISTAQITSDTLRNNDGSKVGNGVLYTITAHSGFITTADADTTQDGIQVASQNGIICFTLKSGPIAFDADIIATSCYGGARGQTVVQFLDNLAPTPPESLAVQYCQGSSQVEVRWHASPEPDVAGYKIHFDDDQSGPPYTGNASASGVPSPIDVMADTNVTVVGLRPGRTYYFAVTSYDVLKNESLYSTEFSFAYTGVDTTGDDKKEHPDIPPPFALKANYPNPFNPQTTIEYSIPVAGHVELSIYNINGALVRTLVDKVETSGSKRVIWDATNNEGHQVASGVYFYRLRSHKTSQSKKMILLR